MKKPSTKLIVAIVALALLAGGTVLLSGRVSHKETAAAPKPALTVTATRLARALWIGFGTLDVRASDNFLDLLPGESATVTIEGKASAGSLKKALRLQTLGAAK